MTPAPDIADLATPERIKRVARFLIRDLYVPVEVAGGLAIRLMLVITLPHEEAGER